MNRLVLWTCSLLLAVPAARASLHVEEDASGETALLTWKDPVPWQAGFDLPAPFPARGTRWNRTVFQGARRRGDGGRFSARGHG